MNIPWFNFILLMLNFDFEDEWVIDIGYLRIGGDSGQVFSGSLFMFYREFSTCWGYHDAEASHYDWDFLYLRQFFRNRK